MKKIHILYIYITKILLDKSIFSLVIYTLILCSTYILLQYNYAYSINPKRNEETTKEDIKKKKKEKIKAQSKASYQLNKEKKREQNKADYQKNKERILKQQKAKRELNKEKIKADYQLNKEKIKIQNKANYQKNKERIVKQQKANREKNKEKIKANYEKNKEKILAQQKASYQRNKEKRKEQRKASYQKSYEKNKEKILAQQKANRELNKEKKREQNKADYQLNKGKRKVQYTDTVNPQKILCQTSSVEMVLAEKEAISASNNSLVQTLDGIEEEEVEKNKKKQKKASYTENEEKRRAQKKTSYELNKEKVKKQQKVYQEKTITQRRKQQKIYRELNKEQILKQKKVYRELNKEKIKVENKAYYQQNKEKVKVENKANYQKNKERILKQQKANREKNKEKIIEQNKADYQLNKGKRKVQYTDTVNPQKILCQTSSVEMVLAEKEAISASNNPLVQTLGGIEEEVEKNKKQQKKTSYTENEEKRRAQKKTSYELNKEKVKKQQKAYQEKTITQRRKQQKIYRELNKEQILKQKKVYRELNKEKIKVENKAYYQQNKEKRKAYRGKVKKKRGQYKNRSYQTPFEEIISFEKEATNIFNILLAQPINPKHIPLSPSMPPLEESESENDSNSTIQPALAPLSIPNTSVEMVSTEEESTNISNSSLAQLIHESICLSHSILSFEESESENGTSATIQPVLVPFSSPETSEGLLDVVGEIEEDKSCSLDVAGSPSLLPFEGQEWAVVFEAMEIALSNPAQSGGLGSIPLEETNENSWLSSFLLPVEESKNENDKSSAIQPVLAPLVVPDISEILLDAAIDGIDEDPGCPLEEAASPSLLPFEEQEWNSLTEVIEMALLNPAQSDGLGNIPLEETTGNLPLTSSVPPVEESESEKCSTTQPVLAPMPVPGTSKELLDDVMKVIEEDTLSTLEEPFSPSLLLFEDRELNLLAEEIEKTLLSPAQGDVLESTSYKKPLTQQSTTGCNNNASLSPVTIGDSLQFRGKKNTKKLALGIPGYSHTIQQISLKSLQTVCMGSIHHTEDMLNTLVLKMRADREKNLYNITNNTPECNKHTSIPKKRRRFSQAAITKLFSESCSTNGRLHIFGATDKHTGKGVCKNQIRHLGLVMSHSTSVPIWCMYTYNKQHTNNYANNKAIGTSQSAIETHNLFAGTSWNTHRPGVTGHILGCYGWGTIKNTRYVNQNETTGHPDSNTKGTCIHIGYNMPLTKTLLLTPSIEYSYIDMEWKPYMECTGLLPCNISHYKEKQVKKNIRIQASWDITDHTNLQLWFIKTIGKHMTSTLSSIPRQTSNPFYKVTIEGNEKVFTQTELGLFCKVKITEHMDFTVNTTVSFTRKENYRNLLQASLSYMF